MGTSETSPPEPPPTRQDCAYACCPHTIPPDLSALHDFATSPGRAFFARERKRWSFRFGESSKGRSRHRVPFTRTDRSPALREQKSQILRCLRERLSYWGEKSLNWQTSPVHSRNWLGSWQRRASPTDLRQELRPSRGLMQPHNQSHQLPYCHLGVEYAASFLPSFYKLPPWRAVQ